MLVSELDGRGEDGDSWDDGDALDALDGEAGQPPRLFWAGASAAFVALASIVLIIWQPAPHRSTGADDSTSSATGAVGFGDAGVDESLGLSAVVHEIVDGARKRLADTRTNGESRPAGVAVDAGPVPVDANKVPVDADKVTDAGVKPDRDSSTPTVDGPRKSQKPPAPPPRGTWRSGL